MNKYKGVSLLSIFLLVGAFGRLFLSHEREVKKKEEVAFTEGFRNSMVEEDDKIMDTIVSLVKQQGRIFIYSNDSLVNAGWVPNIVNNPDNNVEDLMGVHTVFSRNDAKKYFIRNYRSLGFYCCFNPNGDGEKLLSPAYIFNDGSEKKRLYFMGVYSLRELKADTTISDDFKDYVAYYPSPIWAVGFEDLSRVNTNLLKNKSSLASLEMAKRLACFHLYMAAKEFDGVHPGVDSTSFMRSVQVFNRLLQKNGIDTTPYHVRIFPAAEKRFSDY